ncbi:MAG TPA: DJ-1/PfpI family protein [Ensifer sp.]|jgi:putative intracellular protease/amidase|uniref:DJ-1/PfpI family protein n=1 Tax=Ensifer sp. TaxID=1872086 RepID=UPI002E0D35B7|nr:DJ-1/PfpI family protein [Ensifer sp.]
MRLAIVLYPDFADWECALLMAAARTHLGVEIDVATADAAPVTSMGGLDVSAHLSIDALDPAGFDGMVIAGGAIWETSEAPDLTATIRTFDRDKRLIAAICGGVNALAASGLLDRVDHTGNSAESLAALTGYRGHKHYRDQPRALRSGHVVTAAGTAPISFAGEILHGLGLGSPELDGFLALYGREHDATAGAGSDA